MRKHKVATVVECYAYLKEKSSQNTVQFDSLSELILGKIDNLKSKIQKMTIDFQCYKDDIKQRFQLAMHSLNQLKIDNLEYLEGMLCGLEIKYKELKWMEYFNKFQINYIDAEEYLKKQFYHQDHQKVFYGQLGLGKKSCINNKHSQFTVVGEIDIVSNYKIVQKEQDVKLKQLKGMQEQAQKLDQQKQIKQNKLLDTLTVATKNTKSNKAINVEGRRAAVELDIKNSNEKNPTSNPFLNMIKQLKPPTATK